MTSTPRTEATPSKDVAAGAGLREATRDLIDTVAFLASVAASGERLDAHDSARVRGVTDAARAALATPEARSPRPEIDVERDDDGKPRRFWWCPAWGTLNATRFHGNGGPDNADCGVVSYYRAAAYAEGGEGG
jgi:hypothetical protein